MKEIRAPQEAEAFLEEKIGHIFKNRDLLHDALTHPSLAGSHQRAKGSTSPYERLEFLGDRVLGLIVAEWLLELFPDASEGTLAKRHAALVNGEALRDIALQIGLDHHLKLAHGEAAQAERKNLVTLGDAMEALIGAFYLDAGMEKVKAFIRLYWKEASSAEVAAVDPKTALQEWAQGRGLPLPAYQVLDRSGPAHAPKFIVEVVVKGFDPVQAEGTSKRNAEKTAASELLKKIS